MKPVHLFLLTLAILLVTTALAHGQGLPPGLPEDPSQAPIDGGLGVLAAAGGAYALKKLRDSKG